MVKGLVLDVESFQSKLVTISYPYLFLPFVNETTTLVVDVLEEGELPLVAVYKGQVRVVKYISTSGYNVDKLLRTHEKVEYIESEGVSFALKSTKEYLEVICGWML